MDNPALKLERIKLMGGEDNNSLVKIKLVCNACNYINEPDATVCASCSAPLT